LRLDKHALEWIAPTGVHQALPSATESLGTKVGGFILLITFYNQTTLIVINDQIFKLEQF